MDRCGVEKLNGWACVLDKGHPQLLHQAPSPAGMWYIWDVTTGIGAFETGKLKKKENLGYQASGLKELPTLAQDSTCDLKVYKPGIQRVWLSRCDKNHGMIYDNQITVERHVDGGWVIEEIYPG